MNSVVLPALLPVVGLIGLGYMLGRMRLLAPGVVKRLSGLVFLLLTPVLLFRTMSKVHPEQLDLKPAAAYALVLGLVFAAMLVHRGLKPLSAVLALAVTYGNAVMIGIPLITLAWGEEGLVTLLTLILIHSLVLLTTATLALEFAVAHEQAARGAQVSWRLLRVAGRALRKAMLHPVPLPIVAGLLFAQTGLSIPVWLEQSMRWLGLAFGPLALGLVGIALAASAIGEQLKAALALTAIKNLVLPALTLLFGLAFGIAGVPLVVMVTTAALPIGANVFLFSQRYGVAQELVTASVAVSTLLSALSVTVVLGLATWLR